MIQIEPLKKDGSENGKQKGNDIGHVLGVMSGKGGVGKSLVTSLLAIALNRAGYTVGILDADITGPSIPTIFGLTERHEVEDEKLVPVVSKTGIRVVSINLLLFSQDQAVIWRGPLLANTVRQFWEQVAWGKLDYLLVDMPPGTGDVPLTVFQSLPVSAVVLVSSPQDLASVVVSKAVDMCRQMNVPMLGLVQNMAYMKCPDCGKKIKPFAGVDGESMAHKMGIPHLVDLPIDPDLSIRSDSGTLEEYGENPFTGMVDLVENGLIVIANIKKSGPCHGTDDPR